MMLYHRESDLATMQDATRLKNDDAFTDTAVMFLKKYTRPLAILARLPQINSSRNRTTYHTSSNNAGTV